MRIWIDVDDLKCIDFYKVLISSLKEKGHTVTVTAHNIKEIINAIKENKIQAKPIGRIFSFLPLEELSAIFRAAALADYLRPKAINIAISLGSKSVLYTSIRLKIKIASLLDNYEKKLHILYYEFPKSYFIFPENIPEQLLIERGYEQKRVFRCKNDLFKEEIRNIVDVISKIELIYDDVYNITI